MCLNNPKTIANKELRATFFSWSAMGVFFGVVLLNGLVGFSPQQFQPWVPNVAKGAIPFAVIVGIICISFSVKWRHRHAEYWIGAGLRYLFVPKVLTEHNYAVDEHKLIHADKTRGAVIDVGTTNLNMLSDESMQQTLGKLHRFYLGLRWPVQIVIRAWPTVPVQRRWFIAVTADSDEILADRVTEVVNALTRVGLVGRPLNGDLYDSLQACWSVKHGQSLGPSQIKKRADHVEVDGEYVKGLLLTQWPRLTNPNWLAPLIDGQLAVDFSIWLDPIDNAEAKSQIQNKLTDWGHDELINARNFYVDAALKADIEQAQMTLRLINGTALRVFSASAGFVVRGATKEEMQKRERLLHNQLREIVGVDAEVPLFFEQHKAPGLAVPTGEPPTRYPMKVTSIALAMSYPFASSTIAMTGGTDCGRSIGSLMLNTLNLFGLSNPHMLVLGSSGSGKGFWVKVFIHRLLRTGRDRRYVHAGEVREQDDRVRVLVIQAEKDEYGSLVAANPERARMIKVTSFAGLAEHVWEWSGALKDTNQLSVYDITKMPAAERGKAIAFLIRAAEATAEHDRWQERHYLLVIDELAIILRDQHAADAIDTAYRRFRSIPHLEQPSMVSRIGMIGMSQRPSDLLTDPHGRGKVLIGLADTKLYLRFNATEARVAKDVLLLPPDARAFLRTASPGDGILNAGLNQVALKMQASGEEMAFATT